MEFIVQLWLAIVASAAAAWFWSFLSWAAIGLHANDFSKLPEEERTMDALRGLNIPIGHYTFPFARGKESRSPEFMAKWKAGPAGSLHIWNPVISMPRNMLLSFLVNLAVSFLMAYVGHEVLPRGSSFAKVMQVMGTIGVLAYSFSQLPTFIWFQGRPRVIALAIFDGVVTGLAVGAVFAAMWPKA